MLSVRGRLCKWGLHQLGVHCVLAPARVGQRVGRGRCREEGIDSSGKQRHRGLRLAIPACRLQADPRLWVPLTIPWPHQGAVSVERTRLLSLISQPPVLGTFG